LRAAPRGASPGHSGVLEVDVTHQLGRFRLDARFAAGSGLTVLFGRSGSGKTSIVNIIAGLLRPERGVVAVDGATLLDTGRGVFVPKHRRRIGYVFQEPRLFPHLSARGNLLFGRWFSPPAERRARLDEIVDLLGIGHLLDRHPAHLSGGEKQRIAIGRALLASPRLLLMDEPLAALDGRRREEILPYIERLRDEARLPIVYVTHSLGEVARLASTMVLVSDGRIEAVGPVAEIMTRLDLYPMTGRFEAGAVLELRVVGHDDAFQLTRLRGGAGDLTVARLDLPIGAPARVRVRSRDVILSLERPSGVSALNVLAGVVAEIGAADGAAVEVRLAVGSETLLARITRRSATQLCLAPGVAVHALIKTVAIDRGATGPRNGSPNEDGAELADA
jgi:molybdate transport system ATP-binding protein